jgi:hypothetical protein
VLPAMRVAVTLAGGAINQLGSRGTAGAFGARQKLSRFCVKRNEAAQRGGVVQRAR